MKNDGHFITARQEPTMLLIEPSIHGEELWLDAPNMTTLKIKKPTNKNGIAVSGENDSNRRGTVINVTWVKIEYFKSVF